MKDLFSKQASTYAAFRPSYPQELIDYVCSFVSEKKYAWDCATGNGQAAALLSPLFEKITATDISEKQLQLAIQKPNIMYATGKAAPTNFPDNTFDLITVAQAYHWFPFDLFEKEVKRVGKAGSIIAVWGYNIPLCNNEGINAVVRHFYKDIMGSYWDAERKYVDDFYSTVPFAFDELPAKAQQSIERNYADFKKYDIIEFKNSEAETSFYISMMKDDKKIILQISIDGDVSVFKPLQ